jgi:hypothetical protein
MKHVEMQNEGNEESNEESDEESVQGGMWMPIEMCMMIVFLTTDMDAAASNEVMEKVINEATYAAINEVMENVIDEATTNENDNKDDEIADNDENG